MNENSQQFHQAVEKMQSGDSLGAENLMRNHCADVLAHHGEQAGEYAQACYELAAILESLGRSDEAIQALETAITVRIPDDYTVTRNRLTYLAELGSLLVQAGRQEPAEAVLEESRQSRAQFYGTEHSGYAFGLEPLARMKLQAGELEEASELIEQAIDILWKDGHPRVASAFPLRAMILKQQQSLTPTFSDLEDLPDDVIKEMVQQIPEILDAQQPAASQAVIDDLLQELTVRYGPQHNLVLQLQGFLAQVQRWIGPSEGRVESLERLAKSLLNQDRWNEATEALLGLAEALEAIRDLPAAEGIFDGAWQVAQKSEDQALQATVLRNFGLFYDQSMDSPEAEPKLRQAVEIAEACGDSQVLGTCLVALGIYLQHQGNLRAARDLLERGVTLLPPADINFICGTSHLQALDTGGDCGCGDTEDAYLEAFRQHILATMPDGLISDAQVSRSDENGLHVHLDFDHDLDDEETEQVRRAMRQAEIEFRRQMKGDS